MAPGLSIAELRSLLPLLPLLVLAGAIVIALFAAAITDDRRIVPVVTLLGLLGAFVALFFQPSFHSRGQSHGPQATALLAMDSYSAYYMGLIFASAFVVVVFSIDYLRVMRPARSGEYYIVLLLATLGSAILVAAQDFVALFLGVEILSVSLYVLIAYRRSETETGIEAGLKYLILAGVASSFLLFGMALIFASSGSSGSLEFSRIVTTPLAVIGMGMLLAGMSFKLALAPFHMWSPDVYEGAPAPVTAFIATVSKGAVFALLLRLLWVAGWPAQGKATVALGFLAIASMFTGNLAALRQDNLKRLLAYSSISHLGYLLVALLAGGALGMQAAAFYLVVYFIATLIAFGVVSLLSERDREADQLADYVGLFWKRPWIATIFTASILSLAGLPLTAGFIGKFFIAVAAVGDAHWALAVILAVNSLIGFYYYFRVIAAIFTPIATPIASPLASLAESTHVTISFSSKSTLAALGVLLVGLGVYPSPILHFIQTAMSQFR